MTAGFGTTGPGGAQNGWDFHDTYFVTLKKAKLVAIGFLNAAGLTSRMPDWKVQPNLDALHNSPAKPCPRQRRRHLLHRRRSGNDQGQAAQVGTHEHWNCQGRDHGYLDKLAIV